MNLPSRPGQTMRTPNLVTFTAFALSWACACTTGSTPGTFSGPTSAIPPSDSGSSTATTEASAGGSDGGTAITATSDGATEGATPADAAFGDGSTTVDARSDSASSAGSTGDASSDASGSTGSAGTPPSCAPGGPGMTDCGSARENCCTSLGVTGGTYDRTYQNSGSGPTGQADPATVSSFRLDKYVVTVGRFRQFVAAWNGGWMPSAGAGKHAYLTGGGLANTAGGYETGWDPTWNGTMYVHPTSANLTGGSYCDSTHATWTASASATGGGRENLPINCVNWYEAYAFCIWDGGFLPSEAEWEYAAAGGSEERQYPWGNAAPATMNQYAIYGSYYTGNSTGLAPVGTASMGAGLWGQLDLAGEIWEWNLDWKQNYVSPCTDCVNLTNASFRIVRGDNFAGVVAKLLPTVRGGDIAPEGSDSNFGFRCSRAP